MDIPPLGTDFLDWDANLLDPYRIDGTIKDAEKAALTILQMRYLRFAARFGLY